MYSISDVEYSFTIHARDNMIDTLRKYLIFGTTDIKNEILSIH